jgi:hypothetical protein
MPQKRNTKRVCGQGTPYPVGAGSNFRARLHGRAPEQAVGLFSGPRVSKAPTFDGDILVDGLGH